MTSRDEGGSSGGGPPPRLADGKGWFHSFLRNTADVVTVLSADNTVLYDSPSIERALGYAPDERVGKKGLDYVHPDDREKVGEAFAELLDAPGVDAPLGYRLRRKDGSWRHVEAVRTNLLDDPAVGGVVVVYRDTTEREEAEERLRFQARLLDAVGQAVVAIDLEGRITYWNRAAEGLYGWSAGEAIGRLAREIMVPEDQQGLAAEIRAGLAEGRSWSGEFVVRRRDGATFPVAVTDTPVRDRRGNLVGMIGVSADATERREAEEALRVSEEAQRRRAGELSLLHDVRSALAAELDPGGVCHAVVEAVAKAYGYALVSAYLLEGEAGGVAGGGVPELVMQHQVGYRTVLRRIPAGRGVMWRVARTGQPILLGDARADPDFLGAMEGIISEVCVPLFDEGRVVGTLNVESTRGMTLDAADLGLLEEVGKHAGVALGRARLHERLGEAEERFRTAFENASSGVALVGLDNRFLRVNRALCGMLGYQEGELLSRKSFDVTHPDDVRASRERTERMLAGEEAISLEKRYLAKDGGVVWAVSDVSLVRDREGEPSHFVSHVQDITERKEAEEALRDSEERYRAVVEQTSEAIWLFDPGTKRVLESNAAFRRLLGYSAEELAGMTNYDFVAHSDESVDRIVARKAGTEENVPQERRYRRKDGTVVDVEVDGALISYRGREVVCSVARDLTERKKTEERLKRSEASLTRAQRIVHLGSWEWDVGTGESVWSDETFRVLGSAPGGVAPTFDAFLARVHPDDRGRFRNGVEAALGGGEVFDLEHRLVLPDDEVRVVHCRGEVTFDGEGEPSRMMGTVHDITGRKEAEEALKESEERYRRLVESSPEAIAVHDGREVLYANPAAARLFGAGAPEELVGREVLGFVHPQDRGVVASRVRAILEGSGGTPLLEERYLRLDGGVVHAEVAGEPVTYAGKPAVQAVLRDVSRRKQIEEELRRRATHDPLTGLPNRRLLMERLRHALGRRGREVALLFVDLDGFKIVNDSLGHEAGDRLLVAVADRIGGRLRPSDTAARLGGDEFVVLLEDVDQEGAARTAERILAALESPFSVNSQDLRVSASIGIALGGGGHAPGPDEMLREADLAMYRAKGVGKGRHVVYDPAMDARARGRLKLRGGLQRALGRGEFSFRYQPVVSLTSGEVAGLETLLRWEHPERGTLRPDAFLEEAEDAGLAGPLFGLALGRACGLAAGLARRESASKSAPPWVSANLSPLRLRDPNLAGEVSRALSEAGVGPGKLVLEITEDATVDVGGEAAVGRIKGLGARVAVDDFGTGYSSLSYLERLPADFLKLDHTFLANLVPDGRKTAMVRGLIDLAHVLGLAVIAEGVETGAQAGILRAAGCDFAQGHLFAKPLTAEEATSLVAQGPWSDVD